MKKLILSIATLVSLGLFAGCSEDFAGTKSKDTTPAATGSRVYGKIALPAAQGGTVRSDVLNLSGELSILIEDSVYLFRVVDTNLVGDSIIVPFSIDNISSGIKNLIYTADVTVGSELLLYSGYSLISVEANDSSEVSQDDINEIPLTGAIVTGAPQIALESGSDTAAATVVSVSGSVSNSDIPVIIISNNGNNYIFVSEVSDGEYEFSQTIPLESGSNRITVSAVNKSGESFTTEPYTVVLPATADNTNAITATLSWNTAETDLDLHCWYYKSSAPDFSSMPYQHIAYWNMNFEGVAPDVFITDIMVEEWVDEYGQTVVDTFFEESANLDIDDVDGFGPEHIIFNNYPDGYYIFAVNSYNLLSYTDSITSYFEETDYIVSIDVDSKEKVKTGTFTASNEESYTEDMSCWSRCFDVKVSNGVAEIISPNSAFFPVEAFEADTTSEIIRSVGLSKKKQKRKK